MLRQQAMRSTRTATPVMRVQQAARGFRSTGRKLRPMPKEEHSAHTISQRIRSLKKIPPELIPIGVVLFAAVFAAFYSLLRKFWVDKTLRLRRTGKSAD
ncbi:hypothetical protein LTR56_006361 [Elasticomyces elasticus]|nr:hypothetical protein LTR56_006361 [Elasticomyces elasticus]KAK3663406.1 hypothetical protein LTR22_005816 [Elasticomyces elasticus]KAK4925485.1 hypothetical protein LTR49_007552 [Elasticomyces elasticus]KAK5764580.1 hypothetical protein LTS12_005313 [Elasticomyces elasticus]